MDKNAIKKFAVWARRELIARVSQKAEQYGITEKHIGALRAESVDGRLLTSMETAQRDALIHHIRQNGYQQVMEEVAYTWFNRFCALRFMEVNNYLPTRIRVFTDEENAFKPQILTEAIHMEMDGLDMDKVYQFKSDNKTEELYKYLLITQCNALYSILPGMFQQIADYTELLLPDNLLREGSVIEQMISLIPEEDWLVPEDHDKDSIQIIGWLYQYYNAEPKDQVFANLKKNIKISKHDIPAATQLFTPDWIVRYMVENSLGRLWVEGHPDDELKAGWKYYLEEAEQEPDVQAQLAKIREEYAALKPEDIKCIDPCMGSGHILVYMFDVLVQIYQAYGYSTREAVQSIVENNLYGLDIDDRAAQLAYFAVMMKARQYDRRFFTRGIQPHVCAIQESAKMPEDAWDYFGAEKDIAQRVYMAFADAKEYGSLIEPNVSLAELDTLNARLTEMDRMADYGNLAVQALMGTVLSVMEPLMKQARMLVQKYDVVVTNPPYMGSGGMGEKLIQFIKDLYPNVKNDLFSVCIQRMIAITKNRGFYAYIAPQSWMFLSTQEGLRKEILNTSALCNLIDLGIKAFDSGFGTSTAVFSKGWPQKTKAICLDATATEEKAEMIASNSTDRYICTASVFKRLPGSIFSYSCTEVYQRWFETRKLGEYVDLDCGIKTGNNASFVRVWYEITASKMAYNGSTLQDIESGKYKWFKYSQGGGFHRWYGAAENVIDLENEAFNIKSKISKSTYRLRDKSKYFYHGMVWPMVGTNNFSSRFLPTDVLPDIASNVLYCVRTYQWDILAYMNSKVFNKFMNMVNPTVNYPIDSIAAIPYCIPTTGIWENISNYCNMNVCLARADWDAFETSWDFQTHPLVIAVDKGLLALAFEKWQSDCETRFQQLKSNEEELNRIFINIYGLQDELTPEVEDKDVTVRKADLGRDIRSLISYAVGCMFGRYSLDRPGLVYAGGEWSDAYMFDPVVPVKGSTDNEVKIWYGAFVNDGTGNYKQCAYSPDKDGILPISDDDYFTDDIVARFVRFVEVVYGKDTLEENLAFIAKALGGSGTPRDIIRSYFLNDFYADHLKIYQKRPIYWLFDSGKKNGFKALIYMHRYAPDTIARIRTDYVHEQQSRYRTAIADLENRIISASTSERVKLNKQLTKVKAQDEELRLYEEKIHHLADQMISIDLDDGVKVNYAKFADVLAKIK